MRRKKEAENGNGDEDLGHLDAKSKADAIVRLGHLSLPQLIAERDRLIKIQNRDGLPPEDWHRLQAIKANITRLASEAPKRISRVLKRNSA
ncbi:MAG: hypothetical protein RIQ56_315 [Candidatus Parcubacteria bacterium]|jgi:hypothetical protein